MRISRTGDAIRIGFPARIDRHLCRLFARTAIENLVYMDAAGNPIPWLATSWTVDTAAQTVTLRLREGVIFHDGTPFDANAVRWNLLTYMAGGRPELANVETVDVIGTHTVRLRLRQNDNLIIPNLSTSAGMMISPTAVERNGREWADSNPVGTGPFKFVRWDRDVRQIYERFEHYWQEGKPYLDRIEWVFIADPMAQVAAFRRGDLDIIVDITPSEARTLEGAGRYQISKTATPTHLWGLQVDSANPHSPLSNLKVRQAIWHAIDTEAISRVIGQGYFDPLNQKSIPGDWTYNPAVRGYPYNPARARQLLAEAGFSGGVRIDLIGLNLSPNPEIMTAIQGYLKEVGIDLRLRIMERGAFDRLMVGGADWENAMMLVSASLVPNIYGTISRLHGTRGVVTIRQAGRVLIPRSIQTILDRAIQAPDIPTRNRLMHEYQIEATDKYAIQLWIFAVTGVAARQPGVHADGLFRTQFTHWSPQDAWKE